MRKEGTLGGELVDCDQLPYCNDHILDDHNSGEQQRGQLVGSWSTYR